MLLRRSLSLYFLVNLEIPISLYDVIKNNNNKVSEILIENASIKFKDMLLTFFCGLGGSGPSTAQWKWIRSLSSPAQTRESQVVWFIQALNVHIHMLWDWGLSRRFCSVSLSDVWASDKNRGVESGFSFFGNYALGTHNQERGTAVWVWRIFHQRLLNDIVWKA